MYIIRKYTADGRSAGFVRNMSDYRKAARFENPQAARLVANHYNQTNGLTHCVELAADHDCAADLAGLREAGI